MTSVARRFALGLVAATLSHSGATAAAQPGTPQYRPPAPSRATAPASLRERINELGRGFNGRVGIAVQSVDSGWTVGWKADDYYPQQSVSKLWVSIAALDAVDKGRVSLNDRVTVSGSDLTLFHQPIAALVRKNGAYTTTLNDLMFKAITTSDNTANDKLMRSVGGAEVVRDVIGTKGLGKIRFYNGERALQSKIAGLLWSQSYSVGNGFYAARNALPYSVRKSSFDRYVEDPYDGAAPSAIAYALARLKRGEILSPASTARLLSIMGQTKTGANRLKGGLKPGWTLSHKTGTGQVLGSVQAGYNDIGILTAPDGRSYAVAVMIKRTSTPLATRMTLMNNVVRTVINQHEMSYGAAYTL